MKVKKILLVSYDFPPRLGGVATCADKLSASLSQVENNQVKVIAPRSANFPTNRKYKILGTLGYGSAKWAFPYFLFSAMWQLVFWRPDFIICLLWYPDGLATYLAKKFIFWNKTPYFQFAHAVEVMETEISFRKRLRKRMSFLKRAVFARAEKIFAVSHYTKNLVVKNCGVPEEKISIIFNGVDCSEFFPSEKNQNFIDKFNLKGKKVFLTISRLCDYKGIDQALKAFKELSKGEIEFTYLIGGEGPDKARLVQLVKKYQLQDHVIFLGKVPGKDLVDLFNLADCFVLLSRDDIWTPNVEGFGIVFLEAAACGKISIAGDSGGIADAVKGGVSGWLVQPRNTDQILEKMFEVVISSDEVLAMQNGARSWAEQFSWNKAAAKIMEQTNNVRN